MGLMKGREDERREGGREGVGVRRGKTRDGEYEEQNVGGRKRAGNID